ncbi:MAG: hypothetical protein WEE64_00125 [Dehalococcoidia bacterium]
MWIYNTGLPGDLRAKHVADLDFLAGDEEETIDVLSLLGKDELGRQEGLKEWMKKAVLDRTLRLEVLDSGSTTIQQLASAAATATGFPVPAEEVSRWFARILAPAPTPAPPSSRPDEPQAAIDISHWLLPAGPGDDGALPVEELRRWLGAGMWGMGRSTPNRKWMRPGDFVCFYATGVGVVACARLAGLPDELVTAEEWPEPTPMEGEVFKVPLDEVRWLAEPIVVDESLRSRLQAFEGRKQSPIWSWFVQTTRKLSDGDFRLLTGAA